MNNLNISRPFLGQSRPVYPHLTQLLRVTGGTVSGPGTTGGASSSVLGPVLYVSFTQQLTTDTIVPRDREPCLVSDVNRYGLAPGYYLGRLAGSWTSLPVYEVAQFPAGTGGGGGSSPLTYNNFLITYNNTVSVYNNSETIYQTNSVVNYESTTTIDYNQNTNNYNNVVVNYTNNSVVNYNTTIVNYVSTTINLTSSSIVIFGAVANAAVAPPGILSKPTLTVTGEPTWTPAANTYPLLWGTFDNIEWEWDGGAWVPFISCGHTAVNDADHTCSTTDRLIAYIGISAARTVTLPLANTMPAGFTLTVQDESGDVTDVKRILIVAQGGDTINTNPLDEGIIDIAFGCAEAETDGVNNWTICQHPTSTTSNNLNVSVSTITLSASYQNISSITSLLPATAGTYLLTSCVFYSMLSVGGITPAATTMTLRLRNTTTSTTITTFGSVTPAGTGQTSSECITVTYLFDWNGTDTIELQALGGAILGTTFGATTGGNSTVVQVA